VRVAYTAPRISATVRIVATVTTQYVSSIELRWGGRCAGSVAIAHALASQLRDGWRPYGRDKSIP
jgi:hypothetical protein